MNGSARQPTTGTDTRRAPYAAPQAGPQAAAPSLSGIGGGAALASELRPFIPPAFRDWSTPSALSAPLGAAGGGVTWSQAPSQANPADYQELPWIETFAGDAPVAEPAEASDSATFDAHAHRHPTEPGMEGGPEDSWMLGEAGKRLDELTQSLSSLDAMRGDSGSHASEPSAGEAAEAHAMWSDDEWMDIMPAPAPTPLAEFPVAGVARGTDPTPAESVSADSSAREFDEERQRHAQASEAAALALESVARRIRTGDVSLPVFDPELGDAALLAGVLATLLGTRR